MITKMGAWILLGGQLSVNFYNTWQVIAEDK